MTLKEVALVLGKAESTIYKNFTRTQRNLEKKGIILTKIDTDNYTIEYRQQDKE